MGEALLLLALLALWVVSVVRTDAGVVDLLWGPAFSLVFWPAALAAGPTPRAWVVGGLVTVWGLRLSIHLFLRNRGRGEDPRYTAMRRARGAGFWWQSLFVVFLFQGALVWVVAAPIRAVALAPDAPLGALDAVAGALVFLGVALESVADAQLKRFKRTAPPGAVTDRGLWRYSRHPNYFGDCLFWWGLGLFGVGVGAPFTLVGPAVMTVLLVKVSGKDLLEKTLGARPEYARYIARTSGFIPWWPREPPPQINKKPPVSRGL